MNDIHEGLVEVDHVEHSLRDLAHAFKRTGNLLVAGEILEMATSLKEATASIREADFRAAQARVADACTVNAMIAGARLKA